MLRHVALAFLFTIGKRGVDGGNVPVVIRLIKKRSDRNYFGGLRYIEEISL